MVTTKCKKHPTYEGKRPPKPTCPVCWSIYFKANGIAGRPPGAESS